MATLETQRFTFKPNMGIVRDQCDGVMERDPATKRTVRGGLKSFRRAVERVDRGDAHGALSMFIKTLRGLGGLGANELEACCFFYVGFIMFAVGDDEEALKMLHAALLKTQDPWLALAAYNRMTLHHLTKNECPEVEKLADASEKALARVPESDTKTYYWAAVDYNRAEARYRRSEYSEVLSCARAAQGRFQSLGMEAEAAKSLGLLANAQLSLGNIEAGLADANEAIALLRGQGHESELPFILQGKAAALVQQGDRRGATECLQEAIAIYRQCDNITGINEALAAIAGIEATDDDW